MAAILINTKRIIHQPFSSQFVRFCSRVPNNSFTYLFSTKETEKHAEFHSKKPPKTSFLKYPDLSFSGARPAAFHTRTENPSGETLAKNPSGETLAENPSGETLAKNPSDDETPSGETPANNPSGENPSCETPSENPSSETPADNPSGHETPSGKTPPAEKGFRITLTDDGFGGTHFEYASTDEEFEDMESMQKRMEQDLKDNNLTMVKVELRVWVDDKVVTYHSTSRTFEGNSEQVTDRLNLKKTEVPRDWYKVFEKDFPKKEFLRLLVLFCHARVFGGDTVMFKYEIDRLFRQRFPDNSAEHKYLRSVLPELYPDVNYQEDEEELEYMKNLKNLGLSLARKKAVIKGASSLIVQYCYPYVSGVYGVVEAAIPFIPFFFKEKEPERPKGKPEKKSYPTGMLVIMDAVGFNEEDIDITLEHNLLKLEGQVVTIRGGRAIDEEVYITKEEACDPKKVTAELAKGELLVFFPKDTTFTSFFKGKVKKGESFSVSWGDVKQYLHKPALY